MVSNDSRLTGDMVNKCFQKEESDVLGVAVHEEQPINDSIHNHTTTIWKDRKGKDRGKTKHGNKKEKEKNLPKPGIEPGTFRSSV